MKLYRHVHRSSQFSKTLSGWEGRPNRKSGVALVVPHGLSSLSTYGFNGLRKGDEHPAYTPVEA